MSHIILPLRKIDSKDLKQFIESHFPEGGVSIKVKLDRYFITTPTTLTADQQEELKKLAGGTISYPEIDPPASTATDGQQEGLFKKFLKKMGIMED